MENIAQVSAKLEVKALELIEELLNDELGEHSQGRGASYCTQRNPDDGLIDWTKPAGKVYDFIRAQSEPYPGAFTYQGDQRLKIWQARLEDVQYYGSPGQVARITPKGVYVICGDNRPLVLERVQVNGKSEPASKVITSVKSRFRNTPLQSY